MYLLTRLHLWVVIPPHLTSSLPKKRHQKNHCEWFPAECDWQKHFQELNRSHVHIWLARSTEVKMLIRKSRLKILKFFLYSSCYFLSNEEKKWRKKSRVLECFFFSCFFSILLFTFVEVSEDAEIFQFFMKCREWSSPLKSNRKSQIA